MKKMLIAKRDKKGAGLIQGLVMGVAGLVVAVIIAAVVMSTINDAGLLTANSAEANASSNLITNFSTGVNNVSKQIPTILLIAAVVLLLGVIVLLWSQFKKMQGGGGEL